MTTARQERYAVSRYAASLASPPLLTLTLPCDALFALVSRAGNAATGSAMTAVGHVTRTIGAPALATSERHLIGKLAKGVTVTITSAFDLYINTGLGSYRRVVRGA